MSTMKKIFCQVIIAFAVMLVAACSKNKEDVRPGNLPTYTNNAKSGVRIIGSGDLMVNNIRLTNWKESNFGEVAYPYPTPYFPTTGKFSGAYYLPQQFLNENGEAIVKLYNLQGGSTNLIDSFKVVEDYSQPLDYYTGTSDDFTVTRVPRAVTAPVDPGHIRIRLVNLSQSASDNGTERLSLAYADGSIVNNITSGIANHKWSDYIELPYGTYQFKVLVDGKSNQIPGKPPVLTAASSYGDFSLSQSQVYYAPVQTYQPGGVYSIAVAYSTGYQYADSPLPTNCFSVINDVEPPVNVTYGRVQAINAANENGLKLQIDGIEAGSVGYGLAGDYSTVIKGTHNFKFADASGRGIAEISYTINGGDNLSLWVYETANGNAEVIPVQNNMTGLRMINTNPDGSDNGLGIYDPLKFGMLLQTRFSRSALCNVYSK